MLTLLIYTLASNGCVSLSFRLASVTLFPIVLLSFLLVLSVQYPVTPATGKRSLIEPCGGESDNQHKWRAKRGHVILHAKELSACFRFIRHARFLLVITI